MAVGKELTEREQRYASKAVPITVILTLLFQTGGAIWWAATLSAKLDNVTATLSDYKADRYTSSDARRDFELTRQEISEIKRRLDLTERAK